MYRNTNKLISHSEKYRILYTAICSRVPNIETVHLSGSACVRDKDVRCLMRTCTNMTNLQISKCKLLTTKSFTNGKKLPKLQNFNISYCSEKILGNILENFGSNSLVSINLDGFEISDFRPILLSLEKFCQFSLENISFKFCPLLEKRDVNFILSHFPFLTNFNFHGSPKALELFLHGKYCEFNSQLFFKNSVGDDYFGFFMPPLNLTKKVQFPLVLGVIRKHIASRKISCFLRLMIRDIKERMSLNKITEERECEERYVNAYLHFANVYFS